MGADSELIPMIIDRSTNLGRLEADLLDAHAAQDSARLVELYALAGSLFLDCKEIERSCFHYTHAMVLALERGDPVAEEYRTILISHGRESH